MRILLVSHTAELYGAGRALLTLALGLHAKGHVLCVVVPAAGSLSQALRRNEIEPIEINCPLWVGAPSTSLKVRQWYVRMAIAAAWKLRGAIREFRPDLVHTNAAVIPSGALAAHLAGVPHVWHLREHVVEHFGQAFLLGRTASLILMGRWSRALIAISRSVAAAYTVSTTEQRMTVVYDGVELVPSEAGASERHPRGGSESAEPVLALAGILHPAKGQDDAIRALALLRDRGLTCRLVLIGADPVSYGPILRALVDELGVAPYVTFTGHLSDPLPEMAKADVILMCSRYEGFGLVTVEAMLLGKPVVGADTGGTPEIIEDGRTGLLYRQGDPSHLANAIQRLFLDRDLAGRLGRAARETATERFSVERYVKSIESIYRDVTRTSGTKDPRAMI